MLKLAALLMPLLLVGQTAADESLLSRLADTAPQKRIQALHEVSEAKPTFALGNEIVRLILDDDLAVRIEAMEAMAALGSSFGNRAYETEVEGMIAPPQVTLSAVGKVEQDWQWKVLQALEANASHSDIRVATTALRVLCLLGDSVDSVLPPPVIRCWVGMIGSLPEQADMLLEKIAHKRPKNLLPLVSDKDCQVSYAAASALLAADDKCVEALVLSFRQHPDARWRAWSHIRLYWRNKSDALANLERVLGDPDPLVRKCGVYTVQKPEAVYAAFGAAYKMHPTPFRDALVQLAMTKGGRGKEEVLRLAADDPDLTIRAKAIRGCRQQQIRLPVDLLEACLANTDLKLRQEAIYAYAKQAGKKAIPSLLPLLKDREESTQLAAIAALQEIADLAVMRQLIAAYGELGDDILLASVHSALGCALESMGQSAEPLLRALLKDANPRLRKLAVTALPGVIPDEALQLLANASGDQDPAVRLEVVESLADLEDPRCETTIRTLLEDTDLFVRCRAAEAVGSLRLQGLREKLGSMRSDKFASARASAEAALRVLDGEGG